MRIKYYVPTSLNLRNHIFMEAWRCNVGWKKIILKEKNYEQNRSEIRIEFLEWCNRYGHPTDATMYEHPIASSLGRTLFFNPKAVEIAGANLAKWGAQDCEEPDAAELDPFTCAS